MLADLFRLTSVRYDHPGVALLTARAQAYYTELYGGPDDTPVDVGEFAPPLGGFHLVELRSSGEPVAMGGWRFVSEPVPGVDRPAELKRMYVEPTWRGRGLARFVLATIERAAADAGARWLILETGRPQTEALSLYRAQGYEPVAPFGHYAGSTTSVSLGKVLLDRPDGADRPGR